jgi:hypothetical protein
MLSKTLFYCLAFFIPSMVMSQLQPIGNWRDHLPYHQAIRVVNTTDRIWAATPYSLFSVDPQDNTIERWSKISGLHETGINTIGVDETGNMIIIAYNNSNIDILDKEEIINITTMKCFWQFINTPSTGL